MKAIRQTAAIAPAIGHKSNRRETKKTKKQKKTKKEK